MLCEHNLLSIITWYFSVSNVRLRSSCTLHLLRVFTNTTLRCSFIRLRHKFCSFFPSDGSGRRPQRLDNLRRSTHRHTHLGFSKVVHTDDVMWHVFFLYAFHLNAFPPHFQLHSRYAYCSLYWSGTYLTYPLMFSTNRFAHNERRQPSERALS